MFFIKINIFTGLSPLYHSFMSWNSIFSNFYLVTSYKTISTLVKIIPINNSNDNNNNNNNNNKQKKTQNKKYRIKGKFYKIPVLNLKGSRRIHY